MDYRRHFQEQNANIYKQSVVNSKLVLTSIIISFLALLITVLGWYVAIYQIQYQSKVNDLKGMLTAVSEYEKSINTFFPTHATYSIQANLLVIILTIKVMG